MDSPVTLVGEVSASVDSNGRVTLPSTFRDALENERRFYLVKGKDKSLMLYREKDFNENERPRLLKLPPEEQMTAGRDSQFVILDERQNRFLLSEKFKSHAEINKDVIFVGIFNRIRIYSAENFAKLNMDKYEYE